MFIKATLTLLAATLAVAAPSKRQAAPDLLVSLTNTILAVTAEYNVSTDGTPVAVDSTFTFDAARVERLEIGIPEYHCTLYDKSFAAIGDFNPGASPIDPPSQVGLIICGDGLV